MSPKAIVFIVIVLGLCLFSARSFTQEDMRFINAAGFSNPARPAARFNHDAHNEKNEITDCSVCHHVYENGRLIAGESSEDQKCGACHGDQNGDNPISLRKAFHLNCKGCHLEKNAGPILCGQCHSLKPSQDKTE